MTESAPGDCTTPTCTISAGLFRKAMPSPIARRIGKAKVQKTASGSRRNSRKRTMVSSRSDECTFGDSGFTKLPSGEVYEHVFERGRVGRQLRELELSFGEGREQGGDGAMQLADTELVSVLECARCLHARKPFQQLDRQAID